MTTLTNGKGRIIAEGETAELLKTQGWTEVVEESAPAKTTKAPAKRTSTRKTSTTKED